MFPTQLGQWEDHDKPEYEKLFASSIWCDNLQADNGKVHDTVRIGLKTCKNNKKVGNYRMDLLLDFLILFNPLDTAFDFNPNLCAFVFLSTDETYIHCTICKIFWAYFEHFWFQKSHSGGPKMSIFFEHFFYPQKKKKLIFISKLSQYKIKIPQFCFIFKKFFLF